jgi:hypothetical protein
MLWLSRKDIEHISRRLLRDYLKKVPQKVDHIDPTDFAEKMCGLQFTFADISEAHDAIGLTATSGVIITIPQRDGTRLDAEDLPAGLYQPQGHQEYRPAPHVPH